jgi:hypothetical protein
MLIKLSELNQGKKKDDHPEIDYQPENSPEELDSFAEPPAKKIIVENQNIAPKYKSSPKSVSIKDAINGNPKIKDPKIENVIESEAINENQPSIELNIDDEALSKTWKQYADGIKDHKPGHHSLLHSYLPSKNFENQIVVQFESQLQIDLFTEIKSELILYLREKFNTKNIVIIESVQEQFTQNKPYTDDEKFRFLSQKNPNLIKLKQNLNLDFS